LVAASTEQVVALTRAARKMAAHVRSLKSIYLAGSPPSRALLEAAACYLCNDIHCQYSASEVGQIASASAREVLSRPGFAGRLMPGVEVGIFDQAGNGCSVGQIGMVKCRRKGSLPASQTGAASWIELGDLGWRDKDDQLYIAGRAADVSAIGDRSVQADLISTVSEVEHLFRLEWDSTDAGAIVVGDISEPQIWLGVVDNNGATAQDIATIARHRGIHFPITLFDLPAIPRGASGKINRKKLKVIMESMAHSRE
jgi:acyl-coenzyme A synthetase/AMP-(fatty) acid ligase